jgi:hypothetical protein
MDQIKVFIINALVVASPVIIGTLLKLAYAGMGALTAKLNAGAEASKLQAALARITVLADAVVRDIEVSLRPKLVAATADGILTAAEQVMLKSAALQALKSAATKHGLAELQQLLKLAPDMLEPILSGILERAVGALKLEQVKPVVNFTDYSAAQAAAREGGRIAANAALAGVVFDVPTDGLQAPVDSGETPPYNPRPFPPTSSS